MPARQQILSYSSFFSPRAFPRIAAYRGVLANSSTLREQRPMSGKRNAPLVIYGY
jgi:hypothetical protein